MEAAVGGGFRGGGRVVIRGGIGWGWWPWAAGAAVLPYYYPYPYYAPSPPVVVHEQPPIEIPPQQQTYYWYFCQNPQGYYPYVQSCPGGWLKVVPDANPNPPDS